MIQTEKNSYLGITCRQSVLTDVLAMEADLYGWLAGYRDQLGSPVWLLAFADDGVIWGKLNAEDGLVTSAPIDVVTLQTLHLFGAAGELRVWRAEPHLQASLLMDQEKAGDWAYDETYVLYGDHVTEVNPPFTIVSDGRQGLRHAFPDKVPVEMQGRPLRLCVRHYLEEDEAGQAFIASSRLLRVESIMERKS